MGKKKWDDFSPEDRQYMDDIALKLTGKTLTQRREEQSGLTAVEEEKRKASKPSKDEPLQNPKKDYKEGFLAIDRRVADLRDACQMAEWFYENKVDNETYAIREGWDLYDVIHSLVVIFRAWKVMLSRSNVNLPEGLDKIE